MKNLLLILSILFLSVTCKKNVDENRPNVIIILVDDLGYYDLGYMGSRFYETPNIDRIAKEGIIFTQGYSSSRVCSPSRASLMTGKFVTRHGITDYIGAPYGEEWTARSKMWGRHTMLLPPKYNSELGKEHLTIAEALRNSGYKTFFAGKWHLGGNGSHPEDHGFDINKGGFHAGSPIGGFFTPYKNPKLSDGKKGENLTMRLATETVEFIEQYADTNFFAMLSFYAVHSPIQTTKEKWAKYRSKAENQGIKEVGFGMEKRLPIRETQDNPVYGGLVETVDDAVGMVIESLERLNLLNNTLVIFTSDNGGVSSGDNYSTSLLPLRGGKGYQWEGGIRVPFIMRIPNNEIVSKIIDTPIINTDIFPTILDFTDTDLLPEHHIDGVSLKPLILENKIPDRMLFWHYPHYGNQGGDPSSIIRKGNWKLIHYWETDSDELYDVNNMIEGKNLADEYPEIVIELKDRLFGFLEETNATLPSNYKDYNQFKADSLLNIRKTELIKYLEKNRLEMLGKNWRPNEDWWGSLIK